MKRGILYYIITILTLASCGKEGPFTQEPLVMTFDSVQTLSPLQVYSKKGLISQDSKNKTNITNFLNNLYSIGSVNYQSKFIVPDSSYGKAHFTFYPDGKITYATPITKVKLQDATSIMQSPIQNSVTEDVLVTTSFFKYGYDISADNKYNYQYIVKGNDRTLSVSLLSYKYIKYSDQGKLISVNFGRVHNEFNPNFLTNLGKNDTLAVQQFSLHYSVK
ncbi:hypothetical protein ACL9RF_02045 [Sphingobacterium sp. Mn56C]|uniref:hypothetical protein n=1 Tax=Sphingobacterium sp. Mn56C TaxID=3395261 RepID=UPI003BC13C69